jgi:hypothetical protein
VGSDINQMSAKLAMSPCSHFAHILLVDIEEEELRNTDTTKGMYSYIELVSSSEAFVNGYLLS